MKLMEPELPPIARARKRSTPEPVPGSVVDGSQSAVAGSQSRESLHGPFGFQIAMGLDDTDRLTPEVVREQLARNLVLARVALGVTQDLLAERSGVSRAAIAQIEAGASDCRLNTLTELAAALKISPVLLLVRQIDLSAVAHFLDTNRVRQVMARLSEADIQKMNRLRETGLQKNLNRIVHTGVAAAEAAGYTSPGAAVGAGIGSVIQPGAGTAIGALYGVILGDINITTRQQTYQSGEGI
jgi:transcriptional regulator with XRE-family HTH domain